jgi:hypothetical protein
MKICSDPFSVGGRAVLAFPSAECRQSAEVLLQMLSSVAVTSEGKPCGKPDHLVAIKREVHDGEDLAEPPVCFFWTGLGAVSVGAQQASWQTWVVISQNP